MKKIVSTLLLLFGLVTVIRCQTVDSLKVEQAGDFIKIRYKILNSTPDQVFRVKVLCSINGGLNTEIRSISGDVGDMVAGGKPEYWVVWDVLKDVDEIKSVEFIVRAELVKDNSLSGKAGPNTLSKSRFHVLAVVGGPEPVFGVKIGYMGSWGISAMYLKGVGKLLYVGSLDLTKRIVNIKKSKIHLFAGITFSSKYQDLTTKNYVSGEAGIIWSINKLVFSIGFDGEDGIGMIGLGMRF